MKQKYNITEGKTFASVIMAIFDLLGINKLIAKKMLTDPQIKRQVQELRSTLKAVQDSAETWKRMAKEDWRY